MCKVFPFLWSLLTSLELIRFQTYFPHVDNIYSHRSTQRYKRKPFVSHYWDCRLKGRPPGTAKSEDPNKKKRKRQARERDLCDVKIKITEYFTGAMMNQEFAASAVDVPGQNNFYAPGQPGGDLMLAQQQAQHYGPLPTDHPSAVGQKYYTVQRVNGNGGNGKGDGIAGPHKHSLEESDRVKKNSIQRHFLKEEKEKRKSQVSKRSRRAFKAALHCYRCKRDRSTSDDFPSSRVMVVIWD